MPEVGLPPPNEYPRTVLEFEERFATEDLCRDFLIRLRWPEGFRCPRCGHDRMWPKGRQWLRCAACDHHASITAGTIFQGTRKPLRLWFRAMWWVTNQKTGASALGVQRILGLSSYQTAWAWLHKLRRAMVRPGRDKLSGRVEVDETYVGGRESGVRGRQLEGKSLVAVAAAEDGPGMGRVRLARVNDASAASLIPFVQGAVEPGSAVITDGWEAYTSLTSLGYRHETRPIRGSGESASTLLPRVHRVASLLKRWLLGTHQGAVESMNLDYYLDEFTFRFNRRRARSRGLLFYRLAQQAVAVAPAPYHTLIQPAAGTTSRRRERRKGGRAERE